jgi:hypothetical protein
MAKDDKEFASKAKEPADDSAVNKKLDRKAGPPVVQAKDVNSLTPSADDAQDVGQGQVQERVDAEEEAGVRGIVVDPTPNEAYTVKGVTSGQPTPETDESLRAEAKGARRLDGPEPI